MRATHVEAPPIEADAGLGVGRRVGRVEVGFGPGHRLGSGSGSGSGAVGAADDAEAGEPHDLGRVVRTGPTWTDRGDRHVAGPTWAGPMWTRRTSPRRGAIATRSSRTRASSGASPQRVSHALDRRSRKAGHGRAGAGRGHADRDTRPLRDRGEGDRSRHRAAHHALRAATGARHKGLRRSLSSRTTSPTRWRRPTSGSWRRSPVSRRSGSRYRTRGVGSSTSATCSKVRPRTGRR